MKVDTGAKLATIVFLLISIAAGGFFLWTYRKPLLTPFVSSQKIVTDGKRIPNPSPASQTQLIQFADANPNIMGVNIIRVDFQTNTRSTTFRYYKDKPVEEGWQEFLKLGKSAELFGDNEASNQRLVGLINGQFSCVRTLDTLAGRVVPVINQYSLATCMVPIPPGYGDFVGFINIFLRAQPSGSDIMKLETDTSRFSLDIYQRDIVQSTRSFNEMIN